jgi:hypothetical protein
MFAAENIMTEILNRIQEFARLAHADQKRKFEDEPYFTHLVRVKNVCAAYIKEPSVLAVALLHDTLEDTRITAGQIGDFLRPLLGEYKTQHALGLVIELTDVYIQKDYPHWNRRKRKNLEAVRLAKSSAAQTIKYADIPDNSITILNTDDDFASVYLYEAKGMLKEMEKGHPDLRTRAMQIVEKGIGKMKQIKLGSKL